MTTVNEIPVERLPYGFGEYEKEKDAYKMQGFIRNDNGGKQEADHEMYRESAYRYHTSRLNFGLVISGVMAVVAILLLVGIILYFLIQRIAPQLHDKRFFTECHKHVPVRPCVSLSKINRQTHRRGQRPASCAGHGTGSVAGQPFLKRSRIYLLSCWDLRQLYSR